MKYLENLKNNIDFFLRQRLNFSRKNYSEENENKEVLFEVEIAEREKFLLEKYNLESLKENSTIQNYRENLYIIDVLDKYFTQIHLPFTINHSQSSHVSPLTPHLKILDVGCKNWTYAKGEYAFFKKHCENLQLDGIELDANRLYSNFYSRKEVAKFYTKGLENVNYIEGDFLKHNGQYDFIIWILPFVVENPLIKWGLPLRYFKPVEMLKKAYESLKEGGSMLIFNQGQVEHEAQIELCKKLKIKYTTFGEVKSDFLTYNIERYLMLIQRL